MHAGIEPHAEIPTLPAVPAVSTTRSTVPSTGCGYVVCALLVLAGAALIAMVQSQHTPARTTETWIGVSFGATLCLGGLALISPMRRDVARRKERVRREQGRPDEPWTWEPAWTEARGIAQAERRHARAMLMFGFLAVAISMPAAVVILPREIARGNFAALLLLLFPLIGGAFLLTAIADRWRRRKFGRAYLVPAAVPFALGGEVTGMVMVDRPVVATGVARVVLDCWRTTVTRVHNKRRHREEIVSHTERELQADDWKSQGQDTQLFVQIPVRGGAATTMTKLEPGAPTHEWRLRVEVPTDGADFVAEFTLPVFDVASHSVVSAPGQSDAPATAAPLVSRAEVWRAAGIREERQPGASGECALLLPAAIGRSLVGGPVVMFVFAAAIAVAVGWSGGPFLFVLIAGVFAMLPALVIVPLWSGGGERLWVEGDEICVRSPAGALRRLRAPEIERVETRPSVGVGTQQFFRVVARQRAAGGRRRGEKMVLASLVRGDEAAQEIVRWVEERTGSRAG